MALDWIPGLSQVKSFGQFIAGDAEGAKRTQENFFRLCPGMSQASSTFQLVTGNPDRALETQKAFFRNVVDVVDVVPGVTHAKVAVQGMVLGNHVAAHQAVGNVFMRLPVMSQALSATEAIFGNKKNAETIQLEFLRNLGIPLPGIKNFYHYTNKGGALAIERDEMIRASTVEKGDAFFGEGVYFTSLDPRHFSRNEVLRNNYDGNNRFPDNADYVVEVWIRRDEMHRVVKSRDVYLYRGNVDLNDYHYRILINC